MDVMGATQVDLSSAIGRQMAVQQDNVISITLRQVSIHHLFEHIQVCIAL